MTYTEYPIVIQTNWWNVNVYIMAETDTHIEPFFPVYFKPFGRLADISHWAQNLHKMLTEVPAGRSFWWSGINYKVTDEGDIEVSSKGRLVVYEYTVLTGWLFRVSTTAGALDYMDEQVRKN